VRRQTVGVTVAIVALCCLVGYGSYRFARQYDFPRGGYTPPVLVSACHARPDVSEVPDRPVVAFGDSITGGYGATNNCVPREARSIVPASQHLVRGSDTSYPGDLARLIHRPVLNYGAEGETTAEGLPRLQRLLRAIHPSTVILLEGSIDLIEGQTPLTASYRLLRMAALVHASGARPILLTVLPPDGPQWASLARRVAVLDGLLLAGAKADHVTVVDSAAVFAARKPPAVFFRRKDGRDDGLHPNDVGYRVLAVLVYQVLHHA
jgi:lysophospholipase L1-like esterase